MLCSAKSQEEICSLNPIIHRISCWKPGFWCKIPQLTMSDCFLAHFWIFMKVGYWRFKKVLLPTCILIFRGAVFTAGTRNTKTVVRDSVFRNNTAFEGGVFNIEDGSVIEWYNCTITRNFAITSAIATVSSSGHFKFYDSILTQNYANNNPISLLQDNFISSVLNSCQVYENLALEQTRYHLWIDRDMLFVMFSIWWV